MGFTYNTLLEKYKNLRKELNETKKQLEYYKYLYDKEKEKVDTLSEKIKEKDIIIDMFYKMYYK